MDSILSSTYEIQGMIGSGGGGTVYRAYHKRLKKTVVIKKLNIRRANEAENRREADILKNLRHTYLPQVLDYFEAPDPERRDGTINIYTVMDFIEGNSFQKLLDSGRTFTQQQAVKYGTQLLEALVYLHTRKIPILHGDIKPDNIILTPEDNICLIDFNISGVLTDGGSITVGFTPGYAAPEQIQAVRELQARLSGQRGAAPAQKNYQATEILDGYEQTEILAPQGSAQRNPDGTMMFAPPGGTVPPPVPVQPAAPASAPGMRDDMTIDNAAHRVDVRADLYSVGAFLYHLVMGKKLPPDVSKAARLSQYSNFSDSFATVVDKALSIRPEDRYPSAQAMLNALQGYAKTDRRYHRLKIRQGLIMAILLTGMVGCVFLSTLGRNLMKDEREDRYTSLLAEMDEAREDGNERTMLRILDTCEEEFSDRLDAHVIRARALYENAQYEEAILFIEESLERQRDAWQRETVGNLYFLQGNCYYELGMLEDAVNRFGTAVKYDHQNVELYRDYAIALAQNGELGEASKALSEAESLGIAEDQIALVSGEIASMSGDFDKAASEFSVCIRETPDDYIRMRAYILYAKACDLLPQSDTSFEQKAELLEEARSVLPQDQTMLILQQLAQTYIDRFASDRDNTYAGRAADVLHEIIEHGWGNLTTWNNLAVLYQEAGDLAEAEGAAQEMADRYSDRYEPYKRLALIEGAKQQELDVSSRDYHVFEQYYLEAKEKYDARPSRAGEDLEMQILDNAYQELKQEGWL